MIAAAIVCAAVISQGASINWGTGTQVKGPGEGGAFTGDNATGTMGIYVWLVDSETYGKTAVGDIWTAHSDLKDASGSGSISSNAGKKGIKAATDNVPWTADQTTPVYALVLTTLDTNGDGTADWYIANKAQSEINGAGSGTDVTDLAKQIGGSGTAITGWTAASNVPEPTSAMRLLLGMAGLALRRRRA